MKKIPLVCLVGVDAAEEFLEEQDVIVGSVCSSGLVEERDSG